MINSKTNCPNKNFENVKIKITCQKKSITRLPLKVTTTHHPTSFEGTPIISSTSNENIMQFHSSHSKIYVVRACTHVNYVARAHVHVNVHMCRGVYVLCRLFAPDQHKNIWIDMYDERYIHLLHHKWTSFKMYEPVKVYNAGTVDIFIYFPPI